MPARTTAYSNCAQAWNVFGVIGGGIISDKTNSEAECYQRSTSGSIQPKRNNPTSGSVHIEAK